jgi:outer membrane protein assembly factor BamB
MLFDQDGNMSWSHQIDGRIETVAVSTSGYVVAGPRDMHIYVYNRDGELIFTYVTNSYFDSQDVVIAPDEKFFLFGSEHKYLNCYTFNGELLWQSEVGPICNVRISADGEYIAVGTNNSRLLLLDKDGNILWEKKVTDDNFIDEVAISAHGDYIAIDTMIEYSFFLQKRYVDVYSKEGEFLWRYHVDTPIMAIAMSDDGHYIAAGSRDVFVLIDNFQAIEEYAQSECAQPDTSLMIC